MKKRFVAFLFCFFALSIFFFGKEEAKAFSISPLRHTLVVDSGKSETVFVDIVNESQKEIIVYPEVDAFELDPETGAVKFGTSDIAKSWIEADKKLVNLPPQKKERVNFKVSVPLRSSPGSHYLGLFLKEKSSGGQVGIGSRIGTLLFLHVAGTVEEKLEVQDFSIKNIWNIYKSSELFLQLYNNGTIHLLPGGQIEVRNFRGESVQNILVNKDNRKVLPEEVWKNSYKIQNLTWRDVGPVHLRLHLVYGVTNQIVSEEEIFWYTPWWSLVVVGVFGIMIIYAIIFGIKKIVQRIKK